MSHEKKLSIVIPMHNQRHLIGRMLQSIALQDIRENIELIIVDNHSDDDSLIRTEAELAKLSLSAKLTSSSPQGALPTRLHGLRLTHAPHILFLDADDCLLGTNELGNSLKIAIETNADIVQYRVDTVLPNNVLSSEVYWSKPPAVELYGSEIFRTFFSAQYAPLQIWSKILSRELAFQIESIAREKKLNWYEDEFLMALAVFFAKSYKACDHFVYKHYFSKNWPLEKWAKIVQDYHTIRETLLPLMYQKRRSPQDIEIFVNYIDFCISVNMSKLALAVKNDEHLSFSEIFPRIEPWLNEDLFLESAIIALAYNGFKLLQATKALGNDFFSPKKQALENMEYVNLLSRYLSHSEKLTLAIPQIAQLCHTLSNQEIRENNTLCPHSLKDWGCFFLEIDAKIAERIQRAFYLLRNP